MKEELLKIKNLSAGYDENIVLHDIGCTVRQGELIGIIGPNGSGKTTLLRAITRILKPHKGEILIDGKNIWKIPLKEISQMVAVSSQLLDPVLTTVEEYILLGRLPYYRKYQFFETSKDETIVEKYMRLTDTFRLKESLMTELSGGERQLASIARALAQEPILLLLDEPTSHLDITHQAQIMELIGRLNRELGLTVLMVLHDLNLASEYCSRLLLLNNGSIHKLGTPEEVLTYRTIEEVYKTVVLVKKNPLSGKPYVFLITLDKIGKDLDRQNPDDS
ncbi:MAG: ABC transporter ATP-binding protein [Desulfatiglandaceae bacterium]